MKVKKKKKNVLRSIFESVWGTAMAYKLKNDPAFQADYERTKKMLDGSSLCSKK